MVSAGQGSTAEPLASQSFLHNVVRLAGRPGLSDFHYTTPDDVNDDNNEMT